MTNSFTPFRRLLFLPALLATTILWVQPIYADSIPSFKLSELPKPVAANIEAYLGVDSEDCQISDRRLRLIEQDLDNKVSAALNALGYYNSQWQSRIERNQECWTLVLDVQPGAPVLYNRINIEILGEAADHPVFTDALQKSTLRQGVQLNHADYDSFKKRLRSLALRYGYVDSTYESHKLIVDVEQNTADIELIFNSGSRYSFGEVIYPKGEFDQSFLARFQTFETGQPFDSGLIGELQQTLVNTQLFKDVSVFELDALESEGQIPVEVSLSPVSKHVTSLGVGAATDTGPRLSIDYANNRVNSRGHQYFANTQLSSVESSFDFNYQIPMEKPQTERITYKAGWVGEETDTSENDIFFVGGSYITEQRKDWLRTLELLYQVESFEIADEEDRVKLLIPGVNWQRSKADNFLFPMSGMRLQVAVRGAAEQLISDLTFVQLSGSVKYIRGIGENGRFISRLDLATTIADELTELPASLRFFAGGDSSVRGFGYETLGPEDEDGEVIGGLHMLTYSLEYEHYFWSNYGVALFHDAGNAFDDNKFDLEQSVGFGLRWRSPVGPIRLDLGFPVSTDDSVRLHLSMGADL